jgi:hypothetical protein
VGFWSSQGEQERRQSWVMAPLMVTSVGVFISLAGTIVILTAVQTRILTLSSWH